MSSENCNRINELFYAALDQPLEHRQAFVKEACGPDSRLQQEVESLLFAYEKSENFHSITRKCAPNILFLGRSPENEIRSGIETPISLRHST
jgi:hypothetical protein